MRADVNGQPAEPDLAGLLPAEVAGFTPGEEDRFFTADTLFELIDGGAEIYRALNVHATVNRRYSHPDSSDIIADIFDMGSATDAYGAYHNDIREGVAADAGCESEYQGGSLYFWKDRYFVSVVALHETEQTTVAVHGIGQAIAAAIPGDAPPPDLADYLPETGLLSEQIYFFHDHPGLTRRFRVGDGNPLLLTRQTEGLLARYRPLTGGEGSPPFVMLLIRYATAADAKRAHRNFRAAHAPGWREQTAVNIPGGGWTSTCLVYETVAVVIGAPARRDVRQLIHEVQQLLQDPGGDP
jgi:hypothetical protein